MFQHIDITEIIKAEFFQSQGKLGRYRADQYRHFCTGFHTYIVKPARLLKKISSEQEFILLFGIQPMKEPEIAEDKVAVVSLVKNKFFPFAGYEKPLNVRPQQIGQDDSRE
jgi:hypothetical protein